MGSHERIQEIEAVFPFEGNDFSARTTNIGIDIECLPQMVDGSGAGHSSDIKKNTDVWLKDRTKSVEEPTMGINFLLILLLETEDNLNGTSTSLRTLKAEFWCDGDLSGVLVYMCSLENRGGKESKTMTKNEVLTTCLSFTTFLATPS